MHMNDGSVEKIMRYRSFSHMLNSWILIGPVYCAQEQHAEYCMEFEAESRETHQKSILCFQAFPFEMAQCAPEGSEEDRKYAALYHEAIDHARNHFMDCEFFECEFRHKNGYECVQRVVISIWPAREEKGYIVRSGFDEQKENQKETQKEIQKENREEQAEETSADVREDAAQSIRESTDQAENERFKEVAFEIRENDAQEQVKEEAVLREEKQEKKGKAKRRKRSSGNCLLMLICALLLIIAALSTVAYIRKIVQNMSSNSTEDVTPAPTCTPDMIIEDTPSPVPDVIIEDTPSSVPDTVIEDTPSPAPDRIIEDTASPVPDRIIEDTASPVPDVIIEDTASPVPDRIIEDTASPVPDRIIEDTASPVPDKVIEETSSPASDTDSYREQIRAMIRIGDICTLGAYEQDDKTDNGPEDIEWIVIAQDDEGVLLISRYVLDCVSYSPSTRSVSWESSSLRAWMNETFYEKAFDAQEKDFIMLRSQENPRNPEYGTPGCAQTADYIFALSEPEAKAYLTDENRNTVGTAYARAQGAKFRKESGSKQVYWWLRTPGKNDRMAMITSVGRNALDYVGNSVGTKFSDNRKNNTGVRPALWLDAAYFEHLNLSEGVSDSEQNAGQAGDAPAEEAKEPMGTLIKRSVGIREKPDGKARRIVVTEIGDEVRLLGWLDNAQGRWYQVEYEGHTGYLNSTMLEVRDTENLPEL